MTCGISDGWLFAAIGFVWIGVHLVALVFSKTFRKTYRDWATLEDPMGSKIWTKNRWYPWFNVVFWAAVVIFFYFCGSAKNG